MKRGRGSRVAPALILAVVAMGVGPGVHAQSETVAFRGGTIITVSNGVISDGTLLMRDGRITALGASVNVPSDAVVFDVSGKTIMPGLIDGFTNLGTADFPSLGRDDDEAIGPVTPHMRIIDGFNPSNRFIPLALQSGVTAVLSAPAAGNLITGQSGLMQLEGATVEEMVRSFPVAVHVSLGEAPKARFGSKNQAPMTRMGNAAILRQTFIDAAEYAQKLSLHERAKEAFDSGEEKERPTPVARDLKLEALLPVIRGELPLIVGADRFDDIHTALRISAEFHLDMILSGGAEAHRLAPELAEKGIPVIWGPAAASHQRLEAEKGTPGTPADLAAAGIRFAFQTGSIENVTGLLSEARAAFANGLPYEEALKGLTLYPAQIFGVECHLGSLEVGKSADILVLDGDPLEASSRVEQVFVRGRRVEGPRLPPSGV